jgi:hypothetical protein
MIPVMDYQGGQYFGYELKYPHNALITQHTRLKIVDHPLSLIIGMGYSIYHALSWLKRSPLHCIWIIATKWHLDYQRCTTNNCWGFVDSYFQNGAGSMPLLFLPPKAANIPFIDVSNQLPLIYTRCKAQNQGSSIDPHFRNVSMTVSLPHWLYRLPLRTAYPTTMKSLFNYLTKKINNH